ncbi:MAG TPA: hypothetical protein VKB86_19165 [Pyrinomonadaceae bacterium]|nr:hypothetical protein [Pyrinomonadaceae bacterium]
MSEDPTKDMSQKYDTKPTIETVLESISELRVDMQIRLDRIESEVKQTHSELYSLRADFIELKRSLGEHLPALKS